MWKLKLNAHLARKAMRDGERLATKLDSGKIQLDWLTQLLEEFHTRRLHVRLDRANVGYGHGIAPWKANRAATFNFLCIHGAAKVGTESGARAGR